MAIDLDAQRPQVMAAVKRAMRASVASRSKLLGVKGEALAAATDADRSLATAPTLPAIERYTGVLYQELDAAGLRAASRRRFDRSVLIVSGLWGLVAPSDPIPNYKLKMSATLPGLGKLSTWWRPAITDQIADATRGRQIWNLLPNEHDAAWSTDHRPGQIQVSFLDRRRNGDLVAVSHWNKLLKGSLVRFLVDRPAPEIDSLEAFHHPLGYRFEPSLTTFSGGSTQCRFVADR